jgi:hypothetical protein
MEFLGMLVDEVILFTLFLLNSPVRVFELIQHLSFNFKH